MSLLDIIGPIMIGPSSSHTAGAVRIGNMARRIWGWDKPLKRAQLFLRGSFAATYWGHGTDLGLIAGLLRMPPDDLRIPHAFDEAHAEGFQFEFDSEEVDGAHPNSVRIVMSDATDRIEVIGASIGGGAVELHSIDGFAMHVPFGQPALISMHLDVPGVVAAITGEFYRLGLNLAKMELGRRSRGDMAVGVFVLDGKVPANLADLVMMQTPACQRVILLSGDEKGDGE